MGKIKTLVNGACGKMGREIVKAVMNEPDLKLVGAVDIVNVGSDIGEIAGIGKINITVGSDLAKAIKDTGTAVVIDFTLPKTALMNSKTILENKAHAVIGTTGLSESDIKEIGSICKKNSVNALIAPNFAIGAVLMMKFSVEASKFLPKAEIIELHHDLKIDAPSGTALKTSEMMKKTSGRSVPIHSVRLPGLVAHQEVIFGGLGQTLTIRHDTVSRESFMPGVMLAVKKVAGLDGLVCGLENIL
ncbi:MAG: 4-hydroxy-tetrahydrodipicolinate reductase [Candidatus Saganbacteria bacterium]|nr:4-hydroxy-tetrahydrodipicolinate reductase [Candidatus Saganbacteria bacterium]